MFRMNDDELGVSLEQQFAHLKDDQSRSQLDDNEQNSCNGADIDDQVLITGCSDNNADLFLEELEKIDALYE